MQSQLKKLLHVVSSCPANILRLALVTSPFSSLFLVVLYVQEEMRVTEALPYNFVQRADADPAPQRPLASQLAAAAADTFEIAPASTPTKGHAELHGQEMAHSTVCHGLQHGGMLSPDVLEALQAEVEMMQPHVSDPSVMPATGRPTCASGVGSSLPLYKHLHLEQQTEDSSVVPLADLLADSASVAGTDTAMPVSMGCDEVQRLAADDDDASQAHDPQSFVSPMHRFQIRQSDWGAAEGCSSRTSVTRCSPCKPWLRSTSSGRQVQSASGAITGGTAAHGPTCGPNCQGTCMLCQRTGAQANLWQLAPGMGAVTAGLQTGGFDPYHTPPPQLRHLGTLFRRVRSPHLMDSDPVDALFGPQGAAIQVYSTHSGAQSNAAASGTLGTPAGSKSRFSFRSLQTALHEEQWQGGAGGLAQRVMRRLTSGSDYGEESGRSAGGRPKLFKSKSVGAHVGVSKPGSSRRRSTMMSVLCCRANDSDSDSPIEFTALPLRKSEEDDGKFVSASRTAASSSSITSSFRYMFAPKHRIVPLY